MQTADLHVCAPAAVHTLANKEMTRLFLWTFRVKAPSSNVQSLTHSELLEQKLQDVSVPESSEVKLT